MSTAPPADQVHSVQVKGCQRCRQDHRIEIRPLANPSDEYQWWGMCPETNQPVWVKVVLVDLGANE